MDYVRLGNTGLKVSRLCLGLHDLRLVEVAPLGAGRGRRRCRSSSRRSRPGSTSSTPPTSIRQGESERVTGKALKEYAKRHEVVIATKVNGPMGADPNNRGLSRKHILDGIDRSLQRLGVDYVDLYQIHRFDYETPIEETLEALNDVVRAGKARYIGASSMYAWQFMKMLDASRAHGWTPFVSMQPQYNLVYREEEREMLPLCRDQGIGVIPWSPLARGFLAGGRAAARRGQHRARPHRRVLAPALLPRARPRGGRRGERGRARRAASPTCRSRWPGCCGTRRSPRRSSARPRPTTSTTRWPA